MRQVRTKDGKKRYVVRWYEAGRKGARRKATFDREKDADFFDASIRRAKQLGQLASELVGSEQTVAEFLGEWWEKYALGTLKPGTLASYAPVLDKWVVPYLGQMRLRDLSRETIDTYRATLLARGAGAPTVNRCLGILQGVFARGVEWRRISANPVVGVARAGHKRSVKIDAHTPEEVEAIGAVLGRDERALLSVFAYEGLRFSEAAALEFRDVLNRNGHARERMRIERALSDAEVSTTKSGHEREPELFRPVAQELVALYLSRGRPPLGSLIFPDTEGGFLRRQNFRQRVWIPALASVWPCPACGGSGVSARGDCCPACRISARARRGSGSANYFRPHDLRHTCATLLIYEGRTVNEVAEHLGHSDPGFTARTYAHVFADAGKRRRVPLEQAITAARATAGMQPLPGMP